MHLILIAVDGSEPSLRAVRHAISTILEGLSAEIHVLNVQPVIILLGEFPVPDYVLIEKAQKEQAQAILKSACSLLDEAGLKYTKHYEIGVVSQVIVDYAKKHSCDSILMGTRGMGSFGSWVLGSISNQVVHLADVPVTLVK